MKPEERELLRLISEVRWSWLKSFKVNSFTADALAFRRLLEGKLKAYAEAARLFCTFDFDKELARIDEEFEERDNMHPLKKAAAHG